MLSSCHISLHIESVPVASQVDFFASLRSRREEAAPRHRPLLPPRLSRLVVPVLILRDIGMPRASELERKPVNKWLLKPFTYLIFPC